jgi:hypothetical protein
MNKAMMVPVCMLLAGIANANLVMNGSFESGTAGTYPGDGALPQTDSALPGWRMFDTSGSNAFELISNEAEASDGTNFIRMSSVLSGSNLGDTGLDITTTGDGEVLLTTGTTYTVTFDAKRVSGTDNSLWVSVTTKERNSSTTLDSMVSEGITLTSSWTTYRYEVTPVQSADGEKRIALYIGFRPKLGGALQDEVIDLDHVNVVAKPTSSSSRGFPMTLSASETTARLEWHGAAATNYSVSFGTSLNAMGAAVYQLGTNGTIVQEAAAGDSCGFWKVEALGTPQGVSVQNGQLVRCNTSSGSFESFRAFGVNYYDAFTRNIDDASDSTYNEGFAYLNAHHIPVCRVAADGFYPSNWSLYFSDRDEYFRRFDAFVSAAETCDIGLILSLFFAIETTGEIVDDAVEAGIFTPGVDFTPPSPLNTDIYGDPTYAEYQGALGRSDSGTIAFMRHYTAEVVARYAGSPAIWGWEFGNEYNLLVDHPSVTSMRSRSGGVVQGKFLPATTNDVTILPLWTGPDDLTRADITVAKLAFAETVRSIDTWRLIMTGDSRMRPSAYHNWKYHTWTTDTEAEAEQVVAYDNPAPFDTITAHIYPTFTNSTPEVYFSDNPISMDWETGDYEELMTFFITQSTAQKKPLILGEWGAKGDGTTDDEKATFHRLMQAQIDSGVQLSLLWTFDTRNTGFPDSWWIQTGDVSGYPASAKLYQLTNDDPDLWDLEQANLLFNP